MRFLTLSALVAALVLSLAVLFAPTGAAGELGSLMRLERRFVNSTELAACNELKDTLGSASSSKVYFPLSIQYTQYTNHYMSSSSQAPTCVFAPQNPQDISTALKIIGTKRIRFAVQGAGHASNQGFSSTKGIHISMLKITHVNLSGDKSYVDFGAGNVWDNVYNTLQGSGVNVVGGRVSGVGAAGFITGGGGYSWLTNQHGLTGDTLLQVNMILPDGTQTTVSADQNPDIFWAIRGGGNRFGIIYNFRLRTVPAPKQVYGGIRTYTKDQLPALVNATLQFQDTTKDPKAVVLPTFNFVLGQPGAVCLGLYYDDKVPTQELAAFSKDQVRTFTDDWKLRPFNEFITTAPADATAGQRGAFHTVSLEKYTPAIMQLILDELNRYGKLSALHTGTFISYDVEPFMPYSQYAKDAAWPHKTNALPLNLYFAWLSPLEDKFWRDAIKASADRISALARSEGQNLDNLYLYPNYAVAGTDPQKIYGQESLTRLAQIRRTVDPNDVMGLTTYFPF